MPTNYYYISFNIVNGGIAAGSGIVLFFYCYMITTQIEVLKVDTDTKTLTQQEMITTKEEEKDLDKYRRSDPETKQLATDLQQRIHSVSELPNLSVVSNKQQSTLIILFVIGLFIGFAPRLIKRLKVGKAKEKQYVLRLAFIFRTGENRK